MRISKDAIPVVLITTVAFTLSLFVFAKTAAQVHTLTWDSHTAFITDTGTSESEVYSQSNFKTSYHPWAEYEYEIDGITYTSYQVSQLNIRSRSESTILEFMEDHEIQMGPTLAYVHPRHPERSVLIRGLHGKIALHWAALIFLPFSPFSGLYLLRLFKD